jgi:hypothetical protein
MGAKREAWSPASAYTGPVPFKVVSDNERKRWIIADDPSDDGVEAGRVDVRIVEVIDTQSAGRIVVYFRDFVAPDGEVVSSKRRRVGSLSSLRAYISKRGLRPCDPPTPELSHD